MPGYGKRTSTLSFVSREETLQERRVHGAKAVLTWAFLLTFLKTIRRISGKRLMKIRRIIASQVDKEVTICANTKYILCCFRKGLEEKIRDKYFQILHMAMAVFPLGGFPRKIQTRGFIGQHFKCGCICSPLNTQEYTQPDCHTCAPGFCFHVAPSSASPSTACKLL